MVRPEAGTAGAQLRPWELSGVIRQQSKKGGRKKCAPSFLGQTNLGGLFWARVSSSKESGCFSSIFLSFSSLVGGLFLKA